MIRRSCDIHSVMITNTGDIIDSGRCIQSPAPANPFELAGLSKCDVQRLGFRLQVPLAEHEGSTFLD